MTLYSDNQIDRTTAYSRKRNGKNQTVQRRWDGEGYIREVGGKKQFMPQDGRTHHPLYRTWTAMISRCYHKSAGNYALYGGRGIGVCERWRKDFWAFVEDMGEKPAKDFSLDRINVNEDYSPKNCRWANVFTQQANRRVKSNTGVIGVSYNAQTKQYLAEIGGRKNRQRKAFSSFDEAANWRKEQLLLRASKKE